jgi:hypothetical protein
MRALLLAFTILAITSLPVLASSGDSKPFLPGNGGGYHPAPGPIAGAGLPFLAVGYGVYWLVRRRKAQ